MVFYKKFINEKENLGDKINKGRAKGKV